MIKPYQSINLQTKGDNNIFPIQTEKVRFYYHGSFRNFANNIAHLWYIDEQMHYKNYQR